MVTNCYLILHLQGTETDKLIWVSWQGGVKHTNISENDSSALQALQIYSRKTVCTFFNRR